MASEEEEAQTSTHKSRFEEMVTPFDTKTTLRLANFLNPLSKNPHKAKNFLPNSSLLSEIFSHNLHQWPSKVTFSGWYGPQKKWKHWVDQLSPKYSSVWKQAGIHQAIMASVYEIRHNPDTVLGLTEFWCSETNTFLFPWGEATITLEDIMILGGYSVLGDPVSGAGESSVLSDEVGKLEKDFNIFRLKDLKKKKGIKGTHHEWLNYFMKVKKEDSNFVHIAFLSFWLTRFVFPAKHIVVSLIPLAVKLSLGVKLALGPAVLASLYHNLTIIREEALASRDKINVSGPFQLLQIWVYERFPVIAPKPVDLLLPGLPRMARWDKLSLKLTLPIVRLAVKEASNFCWRPYAAELKNLQYPSYLKEKEQSVSDCSNFDDEMWSFYGFLLVSEVVGIDCKEKYFPHRVAMQFGFDQDIPAHLSTTSLGYREFSKFFVPSRFSQPSVTLGYSIWWKGLMLARRGKFKDSSLGKNGYQVSSLVQANGNNQDYHVTDLAMIPFDPESKSSMDISFENHPCNVSPEVPYEDKTRADNDNGVTEEWNEGDEGRTQTDIPTTPTISKRSSRSISPPPGFERLSSKSKKRTVLEFCDNEGGEAASLPCDKKAKVATMGKELQESIQAESSMDKISNGNLVKMEYTSDDDDVVIISHLDGFESRKCSSRKEKSSMLESLEVSEKPKNFNQSSEANAEEKVVEPVKNAAKDVCEFATNASACHKEINVEDGNYANEPPINVGFDVKTGKDSSKECMTSVAKGGERKTVGESKSNPINIIDEDEDVVKAAEAFTAVGYKHIEAGLKLSEDCCKYGVENINDDILAKAASIYGDARKHVEKEQEDYNRLLFLQVLEPIRAMIAGAPLEDARHLAQRYSRLRQEAETQAAEVSRKQARVREAPIPENVTKLHAAEARMQKLRANMAVLGKEAAAALAVESQQQTLTFQRLVAMVEGERTYHERVAAILFRVPLLFSSLLFYVLYDSHISDLTIEANGILV